MSDDDDDDNDGFGSYIRIYVCVCDGFKCSGRYEYVSDVKNFSYVISGEHRHRDKMYHRNSLKTEFHTNVFVFNECIGGTIDSMILLL